MTVAASAEVVESARRSFDDLQPRMAVSAWVALIIACESAVDSLCPEDIGQIGSTTPCRDASGEIAGEIPLQRRSHRVDESVDVHRVDRFRTHGVAHDAEADEL